MKLIIGLGNPDRRYRNTRHNVGWEVIDRLAHRLGIAVNQEDGWATVGSGTVARRRVLLAKPKTYVNLSGTAVADLRRGHRVVREAVAVHADVREHARIHRARIDTVDLKAALEQREARTAGRGTELDRALAGLRR